HADSRCAFITDDIATVDPALDANVAVGGVRFGKAVIDVSTQGVQRHFAIASLFVAGDFSTGQTTRAQQTDAFCTVFHGALHGLAHCATESHTALDLLGYAFCNQL